MDEVVGAADEEESLANREDGVPEDDEESLAGEEDDEPADEEES